MKEVHFTDGVLTWTEVHYRWQKDGKGGDSLDDCLDAWLNEPVEPAPRLARIEAFLNTIGVHKNQFIIFHTEGLREQIATIREKIEHPREWVLKQVVEAEERTLTLIHLLRESNKKSQIARKPRPSGRDPLREKIITLMRNQRGNDRSLKEILYGWKDCVISGLRLVYDSSANQWVVSDEDCIDESQKSYSPRGMEKMFTASK
jgi:hypothetical protein